jgi:hypothetical protein
MIYAFHFFPRFHFIDQITCDLYTCTPTEHADLSNNIYVSEFFRPHSAVRSAASSFQENVCIAVWKRHDHLLPIPSSSTGLNCSLVLSDAKQSMQRLHSRYIVFLSIHRYADQFPSSQVQIFTFRFPYFQLQICHYHTSERLGSSKSLGCEQEANAL